MMKYFLFAFAFFTLDIHAQDIINTSEGDVKIHPISHATMAMEWNNQVIYVDPTGGMQAFDDVPAPDLILITDIHGDHFNQETLEALDLKNTDLIVPEAVKEMMGNMNVGKVTTLANGKDTKWNKITIKAIPMYNLPETEDSRHPKGRGNGYVLTFGDKKIYLSGDTEDIQEMRNLKDIDVAFVCMNLPYTMDIHQAADAVLAFKPDIVYPYHYRGTDGLSDVDAFKQQVESKNDDIEVRLRDWYE